MIFAASIFANSVSRLTRFSAPARVNVPSGRLDALYPPAIASGGQNFACCIRTTLARNPCFHFSIMNHADNPIEIPWPVHPVEFRFLFHGVKSFTPLHRAASFYGIRN